MKRILFVFAVIFISVCAYGQVYYPDYSQSGGGSGGGACSTCDSTWYGQTVCTPHTDAPFDCWDGYTCQAIWANGASDCHAYNGYCTGTLCDYIAYWTPVSNIITSGSSKADWYKMYGDSILQFMKEATIKNKGPMLSNFADFEEQASLMASNEASVENGERLRADMIFDKFNEIVVKFGGKPLKMGEVPLIPSYKRKSPKTVTAFD